MKPHYFLAFFFVTFFAQAQVGIGTPTPNAQLDIAASNQATPVNTDGLLIPRVDEFSGTPPTAAQDGMQLYVTGNGTALRGFYFWNAASSTWEKLATSLNESKAWFVENTTITPQAITDNIFTLGNVAIGKSNPTRPLDVLATGGAGFHAELTGSISGYSIVGKFNNNKTGTGSRVGIDIDISSSGSIATLTGINNTVGDTGHNATVRGIYNVIGGSQGTSEGVYNQMGGTRDGTRKGVYNRIHNGGRGDHYGVHNSISTSGSGNKYGSYSSILASAGGQHYGFYSEVLKIGGFAGYFLGNVSIGTTTLNNYILPTSRGLANQIIQTDGAGNSSWVTPSSFSARKINQLDDAKSDDDGTENGSSIFIGIGAGAVDNSNNNKDIGIGFQALGSNTSGIENTAIGHSSMLNNTIGQANVAVGLNSLMTNNNGYGNTGIGTSSLSANISGQSNNAFGIFSLNNNETGHLNTAIGAQSLTSNVSGGGNTAIGVNAGYHSIGSDNVFIGFNAGYDETGSNKLYIENTNLDSNEALVYGEFDTNILRTNGVFQIGNPTVNGYSFPAVDGVSNQVLRTNGLGSLSWVSSSTFGAQNINDLLDGQTAANSIAIGANTGTATSSQFSTGLGYEVLQNSISPSTGNTALGFQALKANTTAVNNSATGYLALTSNTIGRSNTANGAQTMLNNTEGRYNTAFGTNALAQNLIGNFNTVIGAQAGNYATGDRNVFLGYQSGTNETGNEKLYIENTNADANNALIYGEFDTNFLRLNADVEIKDIAPNVKILANSSERASIQLFEAGDFGYEFQYNGAIDKLQLWSRSFAGNEGERMTWLKNGNVGIGEANPNVKLHISGGTDAALANGSGFFVIGNLNGNNIVIDENEIMARNNGTNSSLYIQNDGGDVYVGGLIAHSSDRRLKKDIKKINYGLTEILKLEPKQYFWKKHHQQEKPSLGLIAQDVEKVLPNIVHTKKDEINTLAVDYTALVPVLIKAMQEQQTEIETLKTELNQIKDLLKSKQ